MNFIKIIRRVQFLANFKRLKDKHNVFRYCKPSVCSKERKVIFKDAFVLREERNEDYLSCQWAEFYPGHPEKAKDELGLTPKKNGFVAKMNVGKICFYGEKYHLDNVYVTRLRMGTSYSGIFNTSNDNDRFLEALSNDATEEYRNYLKEQERGF